MLSGILSDILSGVWLRSGSAHWDLGWGPAVPEEKEEKDENRESNSDKIYVETLTWQVGN